MLREIFRSVPELKARLKFSRRPAKDPRPYDLFAKIENDDFRDDIELLINCQSEPRPSRFPRLEEDLLGNRSATRQVWILAAPFVSERMAALCKKHGWGWFDLAGNCRLSLPGPIYIERTGIASVHESPRPKANLGTAASARVLRALLAPQNAGYVWTQTGLKQHCEEYNSPVSIGLINKVVHHLRDEAWLEDAEDGGFRVNDWRGILEAWGRVYRYDRHRQIGYFTLLRAKALHERLRPLSREGSVAALASFTAAEFQAPNVRQPRTWLYIGENFLEEFADIAEAKPVDSGANVIVMIPDDGGVFYRQEDGDGHRLPCTNPVQTWLDLSHSGGRGEDGALSILDQCLKPAWERTENDA